MTYNVSSGTLSLYTTTLYTSSCTHFAQCLCTRRRVHTSPSVSVHVVVYTLRPVSLYTSSCTWNIVVLCAVTRFCRCVHRIANEYTNTIFAFRLCKLLQRAVRYTEVIPY